MIRVKADLHIHTVLSPCADIEMSPLAIVQKAFAIGLKIIGITDHNSTLHCNIVEKIANEYGIFVLKGVEVTSKEEIHCLAFFETDESLEIFQKYIEHKIVKIKYNTALHGVQAIVNEKNNIIDQLDYYLGAPLDASIYEIEEVTHTLDGIFVPAHVDRLKFSLISQLGYVPENIKADALEIFNKTPVTQFLRENGHVSHLSLVKNSDAHALSQIGSYYTTFICEKISYSEIKMALRKRLDRMVVID